MKHVFLFVLAALALAGCSSDTYIGEDPANTTAPTKAIAFGSGFKAQTRGNKTGKAAADLLGNEFTVYGFKGTSTEVFPWYEVSYVQANTGKKEDNTDGWEYVNATQHIKYWDAANTKYTFFAYSTGTGNAQATADKTNNNKVTFTGDTAALATCYYTNYKEQTAKATGNDAVELQFTNITAKVRLGIFEAVPGYTVEKVKFYNDATASNVPVLYGADGCITTSATYDVTFAATSTCTATAAQNGTTDNLQFDNQTLFTGTIGTAANAATLTSFTHVLPNATGTDLTLKVDYTLKAEDTNETIEVKGKSCVIPAAYTQWKNNYAYTYLVKISALSAELEPITFTAVVVDDEAGNQTTISTLTEPSILTYQDGAVSNEYTTNKAITVLGVAADGTTSAVTAFYKLESAATPAAALPDAFSELDAKNLLAATNMNDGTLKLTAVTLTDNAFTPDAAGFWVAVNGDAIKVIHVQ